MITYQQFYVIKPSIYFFWQFDSISFPLSVHPSCAYPSNQHTFINQLHMSPSENDSLPLSSALTSLLSSGFCLLWIGKPGTFWLYNVLHIFCSSCIYLSLGSRYLMCVLVCLGCYSKNAINWMACEEQTFCGPHDSGRWMSKIVVPVGSASDEGPLPADGAFSLFPGVWEGQASSLDLL